MAKIIIPREELPNLSQEGVNRFRFRVINKNRNLTSQWSVIGNIKRPAEQINYELPNTFSVTPGDNHLSVFWEKNEGTIQEYEVFFKQYLRRFDSLSGDFNYFSNPSYLYEVTSLSHSFVYGRFSSLVGISPPSPQGAQVMIKNYVYPRINRNEWKVSFAERKSNVVSINIQPGVTDFDRSYNSNGTVYIDTSIVDSLFPFTSFADMEVFNKIRTVSSITKTSSHTIINFSSVGPKILIDNPTEDSVVKRIDLDPLFVSEYVNWT
jgi:hypothetical protein